MTMLILIINILFQNFSIKHFPLPLPSQKITSIGMFQGKFIKILYLRQIASVAQLVRAADL